MTRIRELERALGQLWEIGLISGEMHLGIGEEAIAAGVVAHLRDGDGLALDHRSTPPLVARGVPLEPLVAEMLGSEHGLCGGRGGHMHLFDPERLAASSGIVGSAGPMACGFALAGRRLGGDAVAAAFFGDGAANQGMLMESLNLAVAWELPVLFVCKSNGWAITTRSNTVTGGDLVQRARSFGMPAHAIDGTRVEAVWEAAGRAVSRARAGGGPSFVLARCPRTHGHFLGDPLLRLLDHPIEQSDELTPPLLDALRAPAGAPRRDRLAALTRVGSTVAAAGVDHFLHPRDPLRFARRLLAEEDALSLEHAAQREVKAAVDGARRGMEARDA